MIEEQFVSFDTAKMLKEKGFDEPCLATRLKNGNLRVYGIEQSADNLTRIGDDYYEFLCPTLYEAQKWLRKKSLVVEVGYVYGDYYIYDILKIPTHDLIGLNDRKPIKYCSYEDALNDGIKEALKLI